MTELNPKEILHKVVSGNNLTESLATEFLSLVMEGKIPEVLLSSFLTAMKMKGETPEELLGFAKAMRSFAIPTKSKFSAPFLDTCGTGGDGQGTLNVSTLSALVLASMGVPVAKHGNRSVSSHSGSSDLLSQLGYALDKTAEASEEEFLKTGFVFLFAPAWHPAMRFAAPVRKELGFRSFFNLIGPLSNPFHPTHQVLGVYDSSLLEPLAEILRRLELQKAIVCHSSDGLDEFSLFAPTDYCFYDGSEIHRERFQPALLKLLPAEEDRHSVFANSQEGAFHLSLQVLSGEKPSGGVSIVALNAGVALYVFGRVASIREGYEQAKSQILDKKLKQYVSETLNLRVGF